MARSTGGIFISGDNNFASALATAVADTDGYYLIGYQSHRVASETTGSAPVFHAIQVKVLRAGLSVRSPSGFYDKQEASLPVLAGSRTELLRDALYSPFQGDLAMRLSTLYSAGAKDANSGRIGCLIRAVLVIDAHDLNFAEQEDGKSKAVLDVVGAVFGGDDKMITSSDKTFTVNISPEEMRQTVESGLVYQM